MSTAIRLTLLAAALPALFIGCKEASSENRQPGSDTKVAATTSCGKSEEVELKANLAGLSPEDRKLAEAQKFCAVESENRLGSMGVPFKVMVKDQPVFLCCKGCQKKALANPDKTLAKVKELEKTAASPPN